MKNNIKRYKKWASKIVGKTTNLSIYDLAKKFNISKSTVWCINTKFNIKSTAKIGCPRTTPKGFVRYKGTLMTKKEFIKIYRQNNLEILKKKSKLYIKRNILKIKLKNRTAHHRFIVAKSVTRNNGFYWNISFINYEKIIMNNCFYCEKVTFGIEVGSGLDRIDNNLGYTINNVLPCCGDCNRTRGDRLTVEEMQVAMKSILKFRKKKGLPLYREIIKYNQVKLNLNKHSL